MTDNTTFCYEAFTLLITLVEFPPCDPVTNKLRQVCNIECQRILGVVSDCLHRIAESRSKLTPFAELYDMYDCNDPSAYFPNVSQCLFDSQQSCYSISLGK